MMPKAKTLIALFVLVFAQAGTALAGLVVYPADGPPPQIQVEQPKPLEYKVQKGDSVAVIAKKFSIDSKSLLAANNMTDARKLKIGQNLVIPGKTAAPGEIKPLAAAAPAAPAAPIKEAKEAPVKEPPLKEKPDATAKKAGKGEALDPGVVEETPVKGKKGKKGKEELIAAVAPPSVVVDEKTRASFGKTGVITNNTDVPQPIRDEFMRYAQKWVDELDRLGVGTFTNKKVKQVGGQWEASYRVILRESLGSEVKRVEYEHTPYVGHITYLQKVYTSTGPTKEAALKGPYTEKNEAIREIFSYSAKNKAWR